MAIPMRLDTYVRKCGTLSHRDATLAIEQGRVTVQLPTEASGAVS